MLFVKHSKNAYAVPLPLAPDWKLNCSNPMRFDGESKGLSMWVTLHNERDVAETPSEFLEVERQHQIETAPTHGIVVDKDEVLTVGPVSILRLRQHKAEAPGLTADAYWVGRARSDGKLVWIHLTYAGPPDHAIDTIVVKTLSLWAK